MVSGGAVRTLLASAVLAMMAPPSVASAQEGPCALGPERFRPGLAGYQFRENRCEGLFAEPYARPTGLQVVGFLSHPPLFHLDRDGDLMVQPQLPEDSAAADAFIALQVVSLRPRHPYQMDTRLAARVGLFRWALDVLRQEQVRIGPQELAVIGCIDSCAGDDGPPRLVPVSLYQEGEEPFHDLRLIVRTFHRIDELYYTLVPCDETLAQCDETAEEKALGLRFYDADTPITVPLRDVSEAGTYHLHLAATVDRGPTTHTEAILVLDKSPVAANPASP